MNHDVLRREADGIARDFIGFLSAVPDSGVAPVDPEEFRAMVWAGEAKLGTETLCEQLEENHAALPPWLVGRIRRFGEQAGVDISYLNRIPIEPT
ncbi:hypothetical protein [Plantactinospora sp. B24E8]|uniref:hypothetical protein n=1 Tax=Plantactinospora sp. B24E8 TaxID=3153567 RepID=UPI00325D2ECF